MQRIPRGRSSTLSKRFTVAPTGTPTVVVTRSDGTAVSTSSVSPTADPLEFSYTIPASSNPLLDSYYEEWTAVQGGEAQTYDDDNEIQVVGGFLCGLDELRDLFPDTTAYPDKKLRKIRTKAEQRLEKALGWAAVPRYALELRQISFGQIRTRSPLRAVRSLSVNGTVYAADQIGTFERAGFVYPWASGWSSSWPYARGAQALIGYEHGADGPEGDITDAVLLVAQENEGVGAPAGVVSQSADGMRVDWDRRGPGDQFTNSRLNAIVRANAYVSVA